MSKTRRVVDDFETVRKDLRENDVSPLSKTSTGLSMNEVQVIGTYDIKCLPDEVKICITITSSKSKVEDSKSSVHRRYEYVMQCVRNHQCKQNDISESNVTKNNGGVYTYTTIVWVSFTKFSRCQSLCNLLEEKLDKSVLVKGPFFSHSKAHMDSIRRQACMLALEDAHGKATEIADTFMHKLIRPLWVREDETIEEYGDSRLKKLLCGSPPLSGMSESHGISGGNSGDHSIMSDAKNGWEAALQAATITMRARVSACFEMAARSNSKKQIPSHSGRPR